MDQNQINKLTELKKLYESGVLTKEEMEAEKAKILNASSSLSQPSAPQPGNSNNKKWIWIGIAVIVLIIFVVVANIRQTHISDYEEYRDAYEDSIASVNVEESEVIAHAEENPTMESTGEWSGHTIIQGGMYRLCVTCAAIDLVSDGGGQYHGTINISAGNDVGDDSFGSLGADITATENGNKLSIKVSTTYANAGSDGDVFNDETYYKNIKNNSVVFELINNGGSYSVNPVGNMKDYFDGIAEENTVVR